MPTEPSETSTNGLSKTDEAADASSNPVETLEPLTPTSENGQKPEADSSGSDEPSDETEKSDSDSFDEIDLGREFQDYLDPGYKTQEFEYKEDTPSFEQFLSSSETLTDHLEWQLNLQTVSAEVEEAGRCIVGNLDEYGRLNATNEEISELCGAGWEVVEEARQMIMRLEPVGCGVRDIKECLPCPIGSKRRRRKPRIRAS